MSIFNQPLNCPYGAHELKAMYQRNMLIGVLFATSLVLILLGIGATLMSGPAAVGTGGGGKGDPDSVKVVIWIEPPPSVEEWKPPKPGAQPASQVIKRGDIPRPVDDSLIFDDTPIQIASLYDGHGGPEVGDGLTGIDDGHGGGGGGVAPIVDEWPRPTDFVRREVEPSLIYEYVPDYPRHAKRLGLEGRVFIQALIDTLGMVVKAQVGRSSGTPILDEAAVEAAYKNRYTPALQNGRPVMLWVTYDVEFTLRQR